MILSKEVLVKSSKYYESLGYDISDRYINIKIEDLCKGSNFKIMARCFYCFKEKEISYKKYNNNILKSGNFSCSFKCGVIKAKETNLEKYGVDHYSKTDIYISRVSKTNLERFGNSKFLSSNIAKDMIKETNLEKYGHENVFSSILIKEKIKETNLEKYGHENPLSSYTIREKVKETILKKYECNNYNKSEQHHSNTLIGKDENYIKYMSNNISLFNCDKGHKFEINQLNYHSRIKNNTPLCTICNPIGDSKSIKEKDLYEYIKSVYSGELIQSYRDGLEIDIYLPELKLGFEFNGLYWHSEKYKEKSYHLNKTNHFKEKGIRTIHIWEDDWIFRQDIVKSQINSILCNSEKIFARKCLVEEVYVKESRKFLDDNHIQGFVNSSFKIGLYYQDELVSIMTFDSFEGRKKMEDGSYNLSRFCNKLGYNVVGGASKLLSHFIKTYDVKRIVSYADKDWSVGTLYYTLGFKNIGDGKPDYKYIIDNKRVHKSRYKKSNLKTTLTESQATKQLGIHRIYDCGKIKFEKYIV